MIPFGETPTNWQYEILSSLPPVTTELLGLSTTELKVFCMAGANIMRFRKLTLHLGRVEAGSQNNDVQFYWFKVSLFPNVMFYLATFDRQETDTPPEKKKSKFFSSYFSKESFYVLLEL